MTNPPNKPHAVCGAKKRNGEPCQSRPMQNGRCRMHGGPSTGPKPENAKGNLNAVKHGLFTQSLNPTGLSVYQRAKQVGVDEIARDTAEFLVAKVAEAFDQDGNLEESRGKIAAFLRQEVQNGSMSPDAARAVLARLNQPSIETLGKALGPLKGLLEVKRAEDANRIGDSGALSDAAQAIRDALQGAVGRSLEAGPEGEMQD